MTSSDKLIRFESGTTYITSTLPNYHEFYGVLSINRNGSGLSDQVVTDKGIFDIADNYINLVNYDTGRVSYSEYFEDDQKSLIIARDTLQLLGFDKVRTDTNKFMNADGVFTELKLR